MTNTLTELIAGIDPAELKRLKRVDAFRARERELYAKRKLDRARAHYLLAQMEGTGGCSHSTPWRVDDAGNLERQVGDVGR